ncbi:glycosyltransferase [Aromatoleum buckelii]|uniref:Glycosyltransferase n=1 Tax=Aromatoleum buckelii TaxID=200254 RepID=A0ABX1N3D5_9RHOO|nr:glycosyltransferase [Aromatoleum buckelii]MCK0510764.1 glycosyltransferase [Aromatoleum buckelii]
MKRVLMVAFHFPPIKGSSGIQRTLRFVRYLPEFGWEPIVLTVDPRAYLGTGNDQLRDIPPGTTVIRTRAWDAARHFAIGKCYPQVLARPDRWMSWWLSAVPAGLAMIRKYRPHALWSTYPLATAHRIGHTLQRLSGVPWVADFRDPMAQDGYPEDPSVWRSFERIERTGIARAAFSTFTTPSALRDYQLRYPARATHMSLLENGYDEETFEGTHSGSPLDADRVTLLHSGIVYPSERDPTALFAALKELKHTDKSTFDRLRIRFRAPVHKGLIQQLATDNHVAEAIEILPPIAYRDALSEMVRADGLLILQAANCNAQVPAKLYEYLRARRPILALTDPAGDTARIARNAGIEAIAPLDDADAIGDLLRRFVGDRHCGTLPNETAIAGASRRERTRELALLLERAALASS